MSDSQQSLDTSLLDAPALVHGPLLGAYVARKLKSVAARRVGRPPAHDWSVVYEMASLYCAMNGAPERLAELVRHVANERAERDCTCPDERALRRRLGPWIDRYRRGLSRSGRKSK